MGVRHHRELEAWQLCDALRQRLLVMTSRAAWNADWDLRLQVRRAIRSACGNTAEGFWRYRHTEFAYFVSIARGSLGELSSHLKEAVASGFVTPDEHLAVEAELDAARDAVSGLLRYLQRTKEPPPRKPRGAAKPPEPRRTQQGSLGSE
jgi:four helix bundle protein